MTTRAYRGQQVSAFVPDWIVDMALDDPARFAEFATHMDERAAARAAEAPPPVPRDTSRCPVAARYARLDDAGRARVAAFPTFATAAAIPAIYTALYLRAGDGTYHVDPERIGLTLSPSTTPAHA